MVTETVDLLKQLYKIGNPEVKQIILQHYFKEEMEKPTYRDIKTVQDVYDYIFKNTSNTINLKDDNIGIFTNRFVEVAAINAVLNELTPRSDDETVYEIEFFDLGYNTDPEQISIFEKQGWQIIDNYLFARVIEDNSPYPRTNNGLMFYNKDVAQHFLTHFKSSICKWL